ncbi:MAG: hypothetical protein PHQ34_08030 [Methanothrix sp.]|nr:hypothetical protein [Methanothrix sp.]
MIAYVFGVREVQVTMTKYIVPIMFLLISALVLILPVSAEEINYSNSGFNSARDLSRTELYIGNFSLIGNPTINSTVELNFAIETILDAPNTTVKIILPDEIELISGESVWNGDLQKGKIVNLTVLIKPVESGEFVLSARVENEKFKGFNKYFVKNINISGGALYLFNGEPSPLNRQKSKRILQDSYEDNSSCTNFSAGTANVYGYLNYEDNGGTQHPVRSAIVELWKDNSPNANQLLSTSNTDSSGKFSFNTYLSSNIRIFIKILCDSEAVRVTTDGNSLYYTQIPNSGSVEISAGTNYLGSYYLSKTYQGWQAYDYVIKVYQWLDNSAGYKRSKISVKWPSSECLNDNNIPWPCSDGDNIYLPQQSSAYWDSTTVTHEYAHCIMYYLYGNFPNGCHPGDHYINTISCPGFAVTEGWAEFLMCAVDNSPDNCVDITCGRQTNIEDNNWHLGTTCKAADTGSIIEGAVASIWWDIFDANNFPSDPDKDYLSLGFSQIFSIMKDHKPTSINGFWDNWIAKYGYASEMGSVYQSHGINKITSVAIKASNGKFLCAEGGGGSTVVANRNAIGAWETFKLIDRGNGYYALQASNGQYLCAEGSGGGAVVANRNVIGAWETFKLIDKGNGCYALQASNGQYVCAEGGGGGAVVANRNAIGAWEKFQLMDLRRPSKIALQVSNGQYVCAEGGGGGAVVANRNAIGAWETFKLIDRGNGNIALQASNSQYLCAEGSGGGQVVANRNAIGAWENFGLIYCGNGIVALQVSNGQYVCAEGGGGGAVVANRNAIGAWEKFKLISE